MRRHALATIGLAVILLATQGCAGFDGFFENLLIAAGRLQPPDQPVPCTVRTYQVDPGECTRLQNTCTADPDNGFVRGDSFSLEGPPEWLTLKTDASLDTVTRDICAAPDAPNTAITVDFTYVGSRPQSGQLLVTTSTNLRDPRASAMPNSVQVGQTTQLDVAVVGGAPPLRYAWVKLSPFDDPVASLDDPTRRNPIATITALPFANRTVFMVTVTDAFGANVSTTVEVTVTALPLRVTATATPSTIFVGQSTQLRAIVEGGYPLYDFHWSPLTFGDFVQDPVDEPLATQVYQVEVTDSRGMRATASVTVTVLPIPASDQVDIAITVVDSPDPVVVNHLLTYTTTVTNNGPATATNLLVTLVHPSAIETNSPMPSQGTCARINSTVIRCTIGTLASGGSVTIGLQGFPFQPGTLTFRSLIFSVNEADSNPANNDVTQTTTVVAGPN